MDANQACNQPVPRDLWLRLAVRGLRIEAAGVVIAVCLWALFPQSFWLTLVYSLCISTMIWLFIEAGRAAVARRRTATRHGEPPSSWRSSPSAASSAMPRDMHLPTC